MYVVKVDFGAGSRAGSLIVGPFGSREGADAWVERHRGSIGAGDYPAQLEVADLHPIRWYENEFPCMPLATGV